MGVSKKKGTPKSSILIGFSIIFTIHFGGKIPLFLETSIWVTTYNPIWGYGFPLDLSTRWFLWIRLGWKLYKSPSLTIVVPLIRPAIKRPYLSWGVPATWGGPGWPAIHSLRFGKKYRLLFPSIESNKQIQACYWLNRAPPNLTMLSTAGDAEMQRKVPKRVFSKTFEKRRLLDTVDSCRFKVIFWNYPLIHKVGNTSAFIYIYIQSAIGI